jgi:Protein of unknown function (DUF2865)
MGSDWKSRRRNSRLGALLIAALASFPAGALAQSTTCQALRAQLASLGHGGNARAAAFANAAQKQVDEMQRTAAYARRIGCDSSRFFIFGSDPPPQCGDLMNRLGRMQANLANLRSQADMLADGPSAAAQRYQLQNAIRQYCDVPNQPEDADASADLDPGKAGAQGDAASAGSQDQALPPGKPVCVRTCDGYFFPLAGLGQRGQNAATQLCQAQCPGAETELFSMSEGDDITKAVGPGGKSYTELPNALRYQKATVQGCSCRRSSDESWGQALKGAEDVLGPNGQDETISADKAAQMSRPAVASPGKKPLAAAKGQPATAGDAGQQGPVQQGSGATGNGGAQAAGPNGARGVRIITIPGSVSTQP